MKYKCEYCDRVYSQLSSLSRHRRVHKREMDEETQKEVKRRRVMLAISGRGIVDMGSEEGCDKSNITGEECDRTTKVLAREEGMTNEGKNRSVSNERSHSELTPNC